MTSWLTGKRVIITGGDGFIGRYVTACALSEGADVTTLSPSDDPQSDVRHITLDLSIPRSPDLASLHADAMIHLAARSGGIQVQDHEALLEDNIRMTANAMRLATSAGVARLFIASSATVYSGSEDETWLDEPSPTVGPSSTSTTPYAWSKLTGEFQGLNWAREHEKETICGRLVNVFGPGGSFDPGRSTVVHAIIKRAVEAEAGKPVEVWGDGSQQRTFAYVEDAARAIAHLMALQNPPSIVNISTTQSASIAEVAGIIANHTGHSHSDLLYLPNMPQGPSRRLVGSRLLRELGFQPHTNLESAIIRTIESYRDLIYGGRRR